MNNKTINKKINDELNEQLLSDDGKWRLAVKKSKQKYKISPRRQAHLTRKNMEYFKEVNHYEEIKGSDFDDFYS
ncbi:MAG TPA: hypothetical protein VIS54_01435 [Psychromonas sp.]